jgi:trimethylamine:corrinoid methyltransferase-like protein
MLHAGLRPKEKLVILPAYNFSAKLARRVRLPGKAAGQGCQARLPGKAVGQGCRARLPGKAAGQGYRARLQCAESMVKLVENAVF